MNPLIAVNHEALGKLSKEEVHILRLRLNEPLFQKFCELQMQKASEQVSLLNPIDVPEEKATEYLRKAQNYKMIEFFWRDLLEFCRTYARSVQ